MYYSYHLSSVLFPEFSGLISTCSVDLPFPSSFTATFEKLVSPEFVRSNRVLPISGLNATYLAYFPAKAWSRFFIVLV